MGHITVLIQVFSFSEANYIGLIPVKQVFFSEGVRLNKSLIGIWAKNRLNTAVNGQNKKSDFLTNFNFKGLNKDLPPSKTINLSVKQA